MKTVVSNILMAVLMVAMLVAAAPVTSVYAADEPPPVRGEVTDEKLEQAWERQLNAYERMGKAFDGIEERIAKLQERIDKAAETGMDVAALQAALDAYEEAMLAARPAYEDIGEIVDAHPGFDDDGNVTDFDAAKSTVTEMRGQMKDVRSQMGGTFMALRDAFRAFREENRSGRPPKQDG